jgi:hypothetical protein
LVEKIGSVFPTVWKNYSTGGRTPSLTN